MNRQCEFYKIFFKESEIYCTSGITFSQVRYMSVTFRFWISSLKRENRVGTRDLIDRYKCVYFLLCLDKFLHFHRCQTV